MWKKYNLTEFLNLEFDDKCFILEDLMTNEYYESQTEIFEQNEEISKSNPEEDMKFKNFINELSTKLFIENETIEYNLEGRFKEVNIANETFLNNQKI